MLVLRKFVSNSRYHLCTAVWSVGFLQVSLSGSRHVRCGAADRRSSGHNEQKNDRHIREIGEEERTKTQCNKYIGEVVPSSAVVTSVHSLLLGFAHPTLIPHEFQRPQKTRMF